MKLNYILFAIAFLFSCTRKNQENTPIIKEATSAYQPTWESLKAHNEAPEWFQNAKFGIYFHWGVYSVPAFGDEWYPRHMHFEDREEYTHHLEKYGHPSKFGYHDFVPMFKAENFNAEEWADLFQKAGARFAGPVAEHHDGFAMWDSDVTPWNAADKGPKKDITGELNTALKARGLKLITTFHHAKHLQRYNNENTSPDERPYWDSHYPPFKDMPPSSEEQDLKYLYGNLPEDEWLENIWLAKVNEVAKKYQPDIIWFDSWLDRIPETYRQRMAADYLNEAKNWENEVVIIRKQDDLPLDMSVDDLEKSRKNRLEEKSWMTDETISTGSWCYTEGLKIKPVKDVLHVLIDIVSKNGVLLLNISPKANGTIPEEQKAVLLQIGEWLNKYGEAIYDTRPWYTYGEGPTKEPEGHFKNHSEFLKIKYSEKDFRYTTKGNIVYVTQLGTVVTGTKLVLNAFKEQKHKVADVIAMSDGSKVEWVQGEEGLSFTVPISQDDNAPVYKVILN
ncbi:MAG: alpha-L-fucosidase [Bacteroidota bacterium]